VDQEIDLFQSRCSSSLCVRPLVKRSGSTRVLLLLLDPVGMSSLLQVYCRDLVRGRLLGSRCRPLSPALPVALQIPADPQIWLLWLRRSVLGYYSMPLLLAVMFARRLLLGCRAGLLG
jgi:hypothetical protein